jgi:aerobic C4-dicarboxylate transport protein
MVAIVPGVLVGWLAPDVGAGLKPLADGFIKLIKMLIAPIIFCTVVIGIAHVGDLKSVGRIGVKALIYFELVTTFALLFGLVVGNVVQPGIGFNIDPQTLAIAVLFRLALAKLGEHSPPIVFRVVEQTSHAFFTIVGWVMKLAPLGAFGAMAHIIGQYGIGSLSSYGMLIACCYLAALLFIGILAAISWFFAGINLWKFLRYIKDEMFLALGTASTEVVLPRIMVKLTKRRLLAGDHRPGGPHRLLVQPGRRDPLPVHLHALSATVAAIGHGAIPVAAVALLLGADRIMDSMRVSVNLLGSCIATFVVANWEGQLDKGRARDVLDGKPVPALQDDDIADDLPDEPAAHESAAPQKVLA